MMGNSWGNDMLHGQNFFFLVSTQKKMASPGSSGQNTPKRRLRRRVGQGMSGTLWYQESSDTSGGGVITKQSINQREDRNIDRQVRMYTYLNGLPQSQRHVFRMTGHGQMPVAEGGRRYLSMQSQHPDTIKDIIEWLNSDARLSTTDSDIIIQIGRRVLDAVHFLHRNHVVHGDIKPENMIVDSRNHLRLIDFAFSMIRPDPDARIEPQQIVGLRGTRSFMPPELLIRDRARFADIHAYDLWATGIVLLLIVLMYSYKIKDADSIQRSTDIIGPYIRGQQIHYLTPTQKEWVDSVFQRLFPQYDLNLFDRDPAQRYLRPRPRQRQSQQKKQA